MESPRQIVSTTDAPAAIGPYSQAVLVDLRSAGELLFCSGQIPLDPASGELVGTSAAEQAQRCLENLRAVCAAAGTTLERAVRVTVYMTDLERFGEVNEVYRAYFPTDPPARVTVGVAGLPRGAQVEIDAVVALGAGSAPPPQLDTASERPAPASAPAPLPPLAPLPPSALVPPSAPVLPLAPSDPEHVYHVELRHFPRNVCRFNLGAAELWATVIGPWAADRPFELGDLKWDPRQARLTVLEGPRIPPQELSMGRGWSTARRRSQEVTEQLLAAATEAHRA